MSRWLIAAIVVALSLPAATALSLPLPGAAEPSPPPARGEGPPSAREDAEYRIAFECPETVGGTGAPVACPTYVLDHEDVMGSPRLVVDPVYPERLAFSALHGGRGLHPVPGSEPPTGRSRDDAVHQPHTTFSTLDGGQTWADMPYHAPDALRQAHDEVYGDDSAIVLDGEGRLVIAALYSYRDATSGGLAGAGAFRHAVAAWKAHGIERPVDYHVNLKVLEPSTDPDARVDSVHLAYAPDTNVVVLLWRETTPAGEPAVAVHWSRPDDGALWTAVSPASIPAPCLAVSDPIAIGARIVFACREGEEGPWASYALDTSSWTMARLAEIPVEGTSAILASRGGPFVFLVASGVNADGAPIVQIAYGEDGARWSSAEDFAPSLTRGTAPVLQARVTAAAYQPLSGNVHLVYLEQHDLGEAGSDGAGRPEFYKTFASVRAEGTFQTKVDLAVGSVNRGAFSPTLTGVGPGAFDDLHDGIVVWADPESGSYREFVVFGDYGFVRYAEVVEENFLSPIAPLSAQTPPIPAANPGAVPVLVGVPAGILAGSMVARTLWARKQATAEAPSE